MLLYYRGSWFGRGTDDPQFLAKTVLEVMISCIFGGPTLISKILPIVKLNSPFLYAINQSSGESCYTVKAVICDGSRNNKAFVRLFETKP